MNGVEKAGDWSQAVGDGNIGDIWSKREEYNKVPNGYEFFK